MEEGTILQWHTGPSCNKAAATLLASSQDEGRHIPTPTTNFSLYADNADGFGESD